MKYSIFMILFLNFSCNHNSKKTFSKEYICADENKVLRIAEEEWLKKYGNKIYSKKPFVTKIVKDSIWIVEGTLPYGYDGGVPYAEINAKTCEIIKIIHSK